MTINWSYIAGFFDGEGNISIYDFKRDRIVNGKNYSYQEQRTAISVSQGLHFRIVFTQKKSLVLQEIKKFLNAQEWRRLRSL